MIKTTSARGRAFLRAHEGDVLTCYLDPVGIPTIGMGFTMRSRAVRAALAKLGITKLVPGKTKITKAESAAVLEEVLAAEFEPAATVAALDLLTVRGDKVAAIGALKLKHFGAVAKAISEALSHHFDEEDEGNGEAALKAA